MLQAFQAACSLLFVVLYVRPVPLGLPRTQQPEALWELRDARQTSTAALPGQSDAPATALALPTARAAPAQAEP